jgi:hypothetical protein
MAQPWRKPVCAIMRGAYRKNHGAFWLRQWFSSQRAQGAQTAQAVPVERRGIAASLLVAERAAA